MSANKKICQYHDPNGKYVKITASYITLLTFVTNDELMNMIRYRTPIKLTATDFNKKLLILKKYYDKLHNDNVFKIMWSSLSPDEMLATNDDRPLLNVINNIINHTLHISIKSISDESISDESILDNNRSYIVSIDTQHTDVRNIIKKI